ncbi:MAG: hypothetical protein ACRCS8_06415 [Brevinema sp.]
MKKLLLFLFLTSCSVSLTEDEFKRKLMDSYEMNTVAEIFFIREQKDLISTVDRDEDVLEFDMDAQLSYISDVSGASNVIPVWSFVSVADNKAVFRLLNKDAYLGVILDGNVLLVNTNLYSSPNTIKYEWMTSFALRQ